MTAEINCWNTFINGCISVFGYYTYLRQRKIGKDLTSGEQIIEDKNKLGWVPSMARKIEKISKEKCVLGTPFS